MVLWSGDGLHGARDLCPFGVRLHKDTPGGVFAERPEARWAAPECVRASREREYQQESDAARHRLHAPLADGR